MAGLVERLKRRPIIAGVKSAGEIPAAVAAGSDVVFFVAGTLFDVLEARRLALPAPPLLFVHVDLLQGIGRDRPGMQFLAKEVGIDGILTTRAHLVKAAKAEGLQAIQRIFLIDSEGLRTGLQVVQATRPDAVEILPGVVLPTIAHRIPFNDLPPVIAGGLVDTLDEVQAILRTPALAVSTTKKTLWRGVRRGGE